MQEGLQRYIVTPRVAKHRIFVFVDGKVVPDSRLNVFARDDDYFLGVLQSKIHEVWSLANSSRHGVGNDPTYNAQSSFETFPFPGRPAMSRMATRAWSPSPKPRGNWYGSATRGWPAQTKDG